MCQSGNVVISGWYKSGVIRSEISQFKDKKHADKHNSTTIDVPLDGLLNPYNAKGFFNLKSS